MVFKKADHFSQPTPAVQIHLYQQHDYQQVYNYLYSQPQVHYHLDWEPVQKWLHDPTTPIAIATHQRHICGVLAFSPPFKETTWLRLVAIDYDKRETVFPQLWDFLLPIIKPHVNQIATMFSQQWLAPYLANVGFQQTDAVINYVRHQVSDKQETIWGASSVRVRRMRLWENSTILKVDHDAFSPLWQMREHDLREAGRRSYHYTVAINGSGIVGYQMAMRYNHAVHLARLATLPAHQQLGIGSALLRDLIIKAEQIGVERITVNTQSSNQKSQHLYERFGFERDFNDVPVYTRELV